MSSKEIAAGHKSIVEFDEKRGEIRVHNPETMGKEEPKVFSFDMVFKEGTHQQVLFDRTAAPIIDSVLEGFNGTVFAYGQTGTGKTFTMEGVHDVPDLRGLMPRAFHRIFDQITLLSSDTKKFLVSAAFIEIYNDQVLDLLSTKPDERLSLGEKPDSGVYIKGLQEFVKSCADDLTNLLAQGKTNRKVGETAMNKDSSRSHCIFIVTVETVEIGEDGQEHIRRGKLNLVDLAGSERQQKTHAEGARLAEANKINLSLSALGNVINALTKGKKPDHIPYRDSKLTRLLQDSLGGNTKTVMIANLGPAAYNYDETISTLRFATRAKSIKNKPKINEDPKDAMLRELKEQIDMLRAELTLLANAGDADALAALQAMGGSGEGLLGQLTSSLTPQIVIVPKVVRKIVTKGVDPKELERIEIEMDEERKRLSEEHKRELLGIRDRHLAIKNEADRLKAESEAAKAAALKHKQDRKEQQRKAEALEEEMKAIDEAELAARKLALKAKKAEEEAMRKELEKEKLDRELRKRQEAEQEVNEKYESIQEELKKKGIKLEKARSTYQSIKNEIEASTLEQQNFREQLMASVRELTQQLQLSDLVLQNFVPPSVVDKITNRARWDGDRNEWYLEEPDFKDLNVKLPRPPSVFPHLTRPTSEFSRMKVAMGDTSPRFQIDNILDLELDLPDRTTQDLSDLFPASGPQRDDYQDDDRNFEQQYMAGSRGYDVRSSGSYERQRPNSNNARY